MPDSSSNPSLTVRRNGMAHLLGGAAVMRLGLTILMLGAVTLLAPLERTLGVNSRLVYFHGAWVWAGLLTFAAAALCGLAGLIAGVVPVKFQRHKFHWNSWSKALGLTGQAFWLTYLPLALLVMQLNWGGLYLDEPRWRTPLAFGVAGALLQIGLIVVNLPAVTSTANMVFGAALWYSLMTLTSVLHPESPVAQSSSPAIQLYFGALLVLAVLLAAQVAHWLRTKQSAQRQPIGIPL